MFGYATDETEECMPLTILLAHKLNYRMKELSSSGECPWILPDSKSQVSAVLTDSPDGTDSVTTATIPLLIK